MHTPGETPDHLTVWIPRLKAAFIGDNYYESFPNIYTLRGTRPRWALDYVKSLDRVLALEPELVLPSHGAAIRGRDEVKRRLTKYRDAIQYVHDATVKGMNEGKDIVTLMREITLPPDARHRRVLRPADLVDTRHLRGLRRLVRRQRLDDVRAAGPGVWGDGDAGGRRRTPWRRVRRRSRPPTRSRPST